jgi:hypothetical protein
MTRANNKPIKHDSQNIFVNKNSLKIPKIVIRRRKSKTHKQYNNQKKKDKRLNNDL